MNEPIHTAASQAETTPQTQPTGSAGAQTGPHTQPTGTAGGQTGPHGGREANGRFAIGNGGGPGNPFARQTAALHKALVDKVTVEEIRAIVDKLVELANAGNLGAARLLLQYVIGKPAPAVQPDNLDAQEWEQTRATAWKPLRELRQGMGPGLEFPLLMARTSRPAFTRDHARMFFEALHQPKQAEPPRVIDPGPPRNGWLRSWRGWSGRKMPESRASHRHQTVKNRPRRPHETASRGRSATAKSASEADPGIEKLFLCALASMAADLTSARWRALAWKLRS
jgi:hypothetical protein